MTRRNLPGSSAAGANRLSAEEIARREAYALELIAQGYRFREIRRMAKLDFNGYGNLTALMRRKGLTPNPRGRTRTVDWGKREAEALRMLRAGAYAQEVVSATGVKACRVAELRRRHGIPGHNRSGPRRMKTSSCVTHLTHAQLDELEARVAADRAAGRLPPISPSDDPERPRRE